MCQQKYLALRFICLLFYTPSLWSISHVIYLYLAIAVYIYIYIYIYKGFFMSVTNFMQCILTLI